jgi:hypothetical protein
MLLISVMISVKILDQEIDKLDFAMDRFGVSWISALNSKCVLTRTLQNLVFKYGILHSST